MLRACEGSGKRVHAGVAVLKVSREGSADGATHFALFCPTLRGGDRPRNGRTPSIGGLFRGSRRWAGEKRLLVAQGRRPVRIVAGMFAELAVAQVLVERDRRQV